MIASRHNLTTEDQITDIISWMLNIPASQIHPFTHLRDDLYLDAFDIMMLIAKLESRFNRFLTPEEVESIETIRDATRYFVQRHAA